MELLAELNMKKVCVKVESFSRTEHENTTLKTIGNEKVWGKLRYLKATTTNLGNWLNRKLVLYLRSIDKSKNRT